MQTHMFPNNYTSPTHNQTNDPKVIQSSQVPSWFIIVPSIIPIGGCYHLEVTECNNVLLRNPNPTIKNPIGSSGHYRTANDFFLVKYYILGNKLKKLPHFVTRTVWDNQCTGAKWREKGKKSNNIHRF